MLRENWYNVHNVCKWLCWISEKIVMFVFFHHILQLSTLNGYLRVMFASLRLVFAIELVSTRIFSSVKAFFSHKCKDISFLQREQNSNFVEILRKLENNRVVYNDNNWLKVALTCHTCVRLYFGKALFASFIFGFQSLTSIWSFFCKGKNCISLTFADRGISIYFSKLDHN